MSLGIRNIFSRFRHVELPRGVADEELFMNVWLSPYLPSWDYQPQPVDGPWRLIHSSLGDVVHAFETSDDLEHLVREVALRHMPAEDEVMTILDEHCQIILGWTWAPLSPHGPVAWSGCAAAFHILERYRDPVDVAVWETRAREARETALDGYVKELYRD